MKIQVIKSVSWPPRLMQINFFFVLQQIPKLIWGCSFLKCLLQESVRKTSSLRVQAQNFPCHEMHHRMETLFQPDSSWGRKAPSRKCPTPWVQISGMAFYEWCSSQSQLSSSCQGLASCFTPWEPLHGGSVSSRIAGASTAPHALR